MWFWFLVSGVFGILFPIWAKRIALIECSIGLLMVWANGGNPESVAAYSSFVSTQIGNELVLLALASILGVIFSPKQQEEV